MRSALHVLASLPDDPELPDDPDDPELPDDPDDPELPDEPDELPPSFVGSAFSS